MQHSAFFSPPLSVLWPTFQDCIHFESDTQILLINCCESPHTSKPRCHWTEHIVIVYAIQKKKSFNKKPSLLNVKISKYLRMSLSPSSLSLYLHPSSSFSPPFLCVSVCGKIAAIHILATYILLVLPGFSASILRD